MTEPSAEGPGRFDGLVAFLQALSDHNIPVNVVCDRADALMIQIVTPGTYWEVEFMTSEWSEKIQIERYTSKGVIEGPEAIPELWRALDIDSDPPPI
jgi:hypothetical protein